MIVSLVWGLLLFFPLAADPLRWLTIEQVFAALLYLLYLRWAYRKPALA